MCDTVCTMMKMSATARCTARSRSLVCLSVNDKCQTVYHKSFIEGCLCTHRSPTEQRNQRRRHLNYCIQHTLLECHVLIVIVHVIITATRYCIHVLVVVWCAALACMRLRHADETCTGKTRACEHTWWSRMQCVLQFLHHVQFCNVMSPIMAACYTYINVHYWSCAVEWTRQFKALQLPLT